ncbi:MAG: hypothetical protein E4G90_11915 [Gemmatimonadales bacterium]|nr:MAG: hypothetical protein E4G90_11915 [Gemmatimonadales bacterium]
MSRGRWGWALALATLVTPLHAQFLGPGAVTSGFEAQQFGFGPQFGVRSLRQWAIPLAAVVPVGRVSVDIGSRYAETTLERPDGSSLTVRGFTDTQVRGAYVLGEDAVILTLLANLPTGAAGLSAPEYAVLAAASSSFLSFPVNAYGSGASLTGGIATALPVGAWNLGVAGSLRLSGDFTPFRDADGGFRYQAGIETRARLGADRLIGSSRLSIGLTFSTFSDDEFSSGAGATGVYRPGNRVIGEISWTGAIGPVSVVGYLWDFLRLAGDSAGLGARNRENVFAAGTVVNVPMRRTISWSPSAEFRWSRPEEGNGFLFEFTSAFRIKATRRLSIVPALRFDLGRLKEPDPGIGHKVRGIGFSVFLRESF